MCLCKQDVTFFLLPPKNKDYSSSRWRCADRIHWSTKRRNHFILPCWQLKNNSLWGCISPQIFVLCREWMDWIDFFFLRIRDDGVNTQVLVWASLASVWIVLQNTKQLRRKLHKYLTSISVSALSMTHLLVAHFLFMPALQKTSSASCRSAAKSISPPHHRLHDPQRQISSIFHTCFVHAKMDLLNVDSTGLVFLHGPL